VVVGVVVPTNTQQRLRQHPPLTHLILLLLLFLVHHIGHV
jgi:hypothetical protein